MSEKQAKRKRRQEKKAGYTPTQATHPPSAVVFPTDGRAGIDRSFQSISLSFYVPVWTLELYRSGGPEVEDVICARLFARILTEEGDNLLFRGEKRGDTGRLISGLGHALAVASFAPGGIPQLFGQQFDAVKTLASFIGADAARDYRNQVIERYYVQLPKVEASCLPIPNPLQISETTWDVTSWFHTTADLKTLLKLRNERYTNLKQNGNIERLSVATQLIQQVASSDHHLVDLRTLIREHESALLCRLNPRQVDKWIRLHHRARFLLDSHVA